MKALDAGSFPLIGPSLIEASAGTGKTYTIVNLYLRLLLGHKCAPLGIEKILVVTFTNAATAELKTRIRERLHQCYRAFLKGHSNDVFIKQLLQDIPEQAIAAQRLSLASTQMDDAAVFTIHGFSQRMLTQHAFESGAMYEQRFILDESEWLKLAVTDYWRRSIVDLEDSLLRFVLKIWAGPEELQRDIQSLLYRHAQAVRPLTLQDAKGKVQAYVSLLQVAKRWWIEQDLSARLADAKLKVNSKLSNPEFLASMNTFCIGDELLPDFDKLGWANFSQQKLVSALKKGSANLDDLDFSRFEELALLQQTCTEFIKQAYSQDALVQVRINLSANKAERQLLSPDDLLKTLCETLQNEEDRAGGYGDKRSLAQAIQSAYPAVLIDEFQDTDPVQFSVFASIYSQKLGELPPTWIMIGDPKQAIYAFRGADVFTYIQARQLVPSEQQFTLDYNWRSSAELVKAINGLFERSQQGFLLDNRILFHPVKAAQSKRGLHNEEQDFAAIQFQHLQSKDQKPVSWSQAQNQLATHTAIQIKDLLYQSNDNSLLLDGREIEAKDCCILVRDRIEADLIKQALLVQGIASVFLIRKSVYSTQMAKDMYSLLKALAHPQDERLLKTALLSELCAFSAEELDHLFTNEQEWQALVDALSHWQEQWQRFGLMMAINAIAQHFGLEQKLLKQYNDGMRRLSDFRHIVALLQEQSAELQSEVQLLHYLHEHIAEPDDNHEAQQLRLEDDANLVQIITQHASKGLEFPLVFIPFAARHKTTRMALYHEQEQGLLVDFVKSAAHLEKAQLEQLAEDTRLLYVAMTRAVYHCYIGIWNAGDSQSRGKSALLNTALGCLLFKADDELSDDLIETTLTSLSRLLNLSYCTVNEDLHSKQSNVKPQASGTMTLQHRQLNRPIVRDWQLSSYSAISAQQEHMQVLRPGMDEGRDVESSETGMESLKTVDFAFEFQRGAKAGSFLHGVLENIDFQQPQQLSEAINQQGMWFGIEEPQFEPLEQWLKQVLLSPIKLNDSSSITLSSISNGQRLVEMEFFMPLKAVKVKAFNAVINRYNPQQSRSYQFEQLNGMIKGFIDLIFEFNGKYYVADYKSNHLGNEYEAYNEVNMEQAMSEHDYHLQGVLYTLALHRWLGKKRADYNYKQHIGGAYYLFIRGMHPQHPACGVYHMLPDQVLIEALDSLFAGAEPAAQQSTGKLSSDNSSSGQLDLW